MTITAAPTVPEIDFLASRARVHAGDDGIGLVDVVSPAGDMAPLHVHHSHDEGFFVLEGVVTLYLPGRAITLRPGQFMLAPRGVPHTYRIDEGPARKIVTSTPAGFERFVAEVGSTGVTDPATLAEVAARYDIEILGPPGMLP
jgi:quercetin dioxygenase-like cupin family protein